MYFDLGVARKFAPPMKKLACLPLPPFPLALRETQTPPPPDMKRRCPHVRRVWMAAITVAVAVAKQFVPAKVRI